VTATGELDDHDHDDDQEGKEARGRRTVKVLPAPGREPTTIEPW